MYPEISLVLSFIYIWHYLPFYRKSDPLTRKIVQKNSSDLCGLCSHQYFGNQSNCTNHRNIWTMEARQQMNGQNKTQPEPLMRRSRGEP